MTDLVPDSTPTPVSQPPAPLAPVVTPTAPKSAPVRFGLAIALIAGLSFIAGLKFFGVSKTDEPKANESAKSGDATKVGDRNEALEQFIMSKTGARLEDMFLATKLILEKPPAPNPKPAPLTDPNPAPKVIPKPEPEPLPPESLKFAGHKAGEEWSANEMAMKFCWCPAGTFMMGSPKAEQERDRNQLASSDEVEVTLTKGFWLAKFETTQAQWDKIMGTILIQQSDMAWSQNNWETENQGYFDDWWDMNRLKWRPQPRMRQPWEPNLGEGPSFPMYYVNHLEAAQFCQILTQREQKAGRLPPGWEFRLPTEAQWEYACRAGTKTATAFGDSLSSLQANFDGNFPYNGALPAPMVGGMQPVGSYRPNAWGLFDMHGNAWEWCRDWDGQRPGGNDPENKSGDLNRVIRGGGWRYKGIFCRSATRLSLQWSTQNAETGFRVAIVQTPLKPKPAPDPIPNAKSLPKGVLVNSIGMKLAPIPAGKFLMGSPVYEPGRAWLGRDEIDFEEQHPVTIREPFYLGVYLVTQDQYQRIMGNTPGYKPSWFSPSGGGKDKVWRFKDTGQFPRDSIALEDAREFCKRLSDLPEEKKFGRVYRVPTEEEWEYACRAGTTTPFYFGNTVTDEQANFGNSLGRTTPVGHYNNPNKFGLYDMCGNLAQWCEGAYASYLEEQRNPNQAYPYVRRGGYWAMASLACRSASRQQGGAANMYSGFRIALTVDPAIGQPIIDPPAAKLPADDVQPKQFPMVDPGRQPSGADEKKEVSSALVIAALGDLKSPDKTIRRFAAERLANLQPEANREKVSKELERMMRDHDIFVLGAATRALTVWGGKENISGLIELTTDQNIFNRAGAIQVLGTLKDERAAEAVARRLSNNFDRGKASDTLKGMGPMAEAVVLKRLGSEIKEVRIECFKILRDIGTEKCIPAVEQATRDRDPDVAKEARLTLAEVRN
jgi:formylglycine-generating enzyme required for sulfatase activity